MNRYGIKPGPADTYVHEQPVVQDIYQKQIKSK